MVYHLHRQQFVPGEPARIWEFFATPRNLDTLTPPSLRFVILGDVTPRMHAGQMIEYRIRILPGVWTRWRTEITQVRDGELFVDEQRLGPYRLWRHEHHFARAPGGVTMTDHVAYDPGWGPLGGIVNAIWLHRRLAGIFDYRARKIAELFPGRY